MRGGRETEKAEGMGRWAEGARGGEESYEAKWPWSERNWNDVDQLTLYQMTSMTDRL
jgi:hypothetical protein